MKTFLPYPFQLGSCIIMLVAFLWLTIGTSFLSLARQKQFNDKITSNKAEKNDAENDAVPFENAKEEKTENGPTTLSEEYLTEHTEHLTYTNIPLRHNKCHTADAFIAYYGESASQPPDAFLAKIF